MFKLGQSVKLYSFKSEQSVKGIIRRTDPNNDVEVWVNNYTEIINLESIGHPISDLDKGLFFIKGTDEQVRVVPITQVRRRLNTVANLSLTIPLSQFFIDSRDNLEEAIFLIKNIRTYLLKNKIHEIISMAINDPTITRYVLIRDLKYGGDDGKGWDGIAWYDYRVKVENEALVGIIKDKLEKAKLI